MDLDWSGCMDPRGGALTLNMGLIWRVGLYLKHWPDMLQVGGAGEGRLHMAHSLHQGLGRLGHLLHLQIVEEPPLLFTSHAYRGEEPMTG